ncbi:MAG: fused response regulator/phosphatase [Pirellulales bacterium]
MTSGESAESRRSTIGRDVIIAEDSRIQAKILQKRLTEAGHSVRWGANGAEALELVKEQIPDIIISDIEMPEMTGYEFCKNVKTDPNFCAIPFILLSTLSDPIDIIRGLDAGADNYVTKPYESDYLLGRMQSLLESPVSDAADHATLEVAIAGQKFQVQAGRQQVLNLLVSTFENAVAKNQELLTANENLTMARENLQKTNSELTVLNQEISRKNARMIRDLEAAAKVQRSLLPTESVDLPQATIAWKYVPCEGLAGDFLNVFLLDEHHAGLFVVDVSGHGVPSSLMAVTVGRFLTNKISDQSILVRQGDDKEIVIASPSEVVTQLNKLFQADDFSGLYFTIIYGVLDLRTGQLDYVSGGHPALVRVSSSGKADFHPAEGFPVGFIPDAEYTQQTLQLDPGDRVFFYSDGVPEAMDKDLNPLGDDALAEHVAASRALPLEQSVSGLLETVQQWCQPKGPLDDVSILGVEWQG